VKIAQKVPTKTQIRHIYPLEDCIYPRNEIMVHVLEFSTITVKKDGPEAVLNLLPAFSVFLCSTGARSMEAMFPDIPCNSFQFPTHQ
jgi:hypothetical protein